MSEAMPERRIQVILLHRYSNPNDSSDRLLLQSEESSWYLGTGWRVDQSGALHVMSDDVADITFASGRWLEVYWGD